MLLVGYPQPSPDGPKKCQRKNPRFQVGEEDHLESREGDRREGGQLRDVQRGDRRKVDTKPEPHGFYMFLLDLFWEKDMK